MKNFSHYKKTLKTSLFLTGITLFSTTHAAPLSKSDAESIIDKLGFKAVQSTLSDKSKNTTDILIGGNVYKECRDKIEFVAAQNDAGAGVQINDKGGFKDCQDKNKAVAGAEVVNLSKEGLKISLSTLKSSEKIGVIYEDESSSFAEGKVDEIGEGLVYVSAADLKVKEKKIADDKKAADKAAEIKRHQSIVAYCKDPEYTDDVMDSIEKLIKLDSANKSIYEKDKEKLEEAQLELDKKSFSKDVETLRADILKIQKPEDVDAIIERLSEMAPGDEDQERLLAQACRQLAETQFSRSAQANIDQALATSAATNKTCGESIDVDEAIIKDVQGGFSEGLQCTGVLAVMTNTGNPKFESQRQFCSQQFSQQYTSMGCLMNAAANPQCAALQNQIKQLGTVLPEQYKLAQLGQAAAGACSINLNSKNCADAQKALSDQQAKIDSALQTANNTNSQGGSISPLGQNAASSSGAPAIPFDMNQLSAYVAGLNKFSMNNTQPKAPGEEIMAAVQKTLGNNKSN